MLHVKGVRVDILRLKTTLQMLQTTSPSYIILGSLDLSRYQMVHEGENSWSKWSTFVRRPGGNQ